MPGEPLVSVVMPVRNGEVFLVEGIESVLGQTYENWELVVVDNCSSDRTLEIARTYAERDRRIRVLRNETPLTLMENHNVAFRAVSTASRYCKILHADDWLFPECLTRMVEVAERNLSVGLVGSYCLYGDEVRCDGLPVTVTVLSGRDMGRKTLFREFYAFVSPSAIMVRSDLLRSGRFRYHESHIHADVEACLEALRYCDFGFVHQVLTFVRPHGDSVTATVANRLNTYHWSWLDMLRAYGPVYLTHDEYERLWRARVRAYYGFLGQNVLRRRSREFWTYHKERLDDLGLPLTASRVVAGLIREAVQVVLHPVREFRRGLQPVR
ncbi:MAG: glycosyltransferase family 2 protein [Armatimonadota bacterium]|nr:glycosyltransferase family 2 protein [Armatimonadota bacterium]